MEELIFNVADMTFFFNDLEDCDQVNFDIYHLPYTLLEYAKTDALSIAKNYNILHL